MAGVTAAQLVVRVSADTSKAEQGLQSISEKTESAGSGLRGFAGTLAGFTGAQMVLNAAGAAFGFLQGQIMDAWQQGIEANQVMGQITAGLKSTHDASGETAQSIANLATQIMNYSGIDDSAVEAGQSILLTFTNIKAKGGIFDQATKSAADMATKMAQGAVPSAQQMQEASLQLGKALNDPIHGVTALQKVGVSFTQQQKDQIATMMKHGDVAGAQGVILKELNREMGGSAKAAGDANGGMAKWTAQINNSKQALGQAFIPIVSKLVSALAPLIVQLANDIPPAIKWVQQHFEPLSPLFGVLAGIIGGALVASLVGAAIAAWGLVAPMLVMALPFIAVGAAVGLVTVGIILLIKHWKEVSAWLQGVWHAVVTKVGQGFSELGAKAQQLWQTIQQKFIAGISWFDSIPGRIRQAIQNNIVTPLKNEIKGVVTTAEQWGHNLIQSFINGIQNMIGNVRNAAANVVNNVKSFLGFHSPAKEGPGSDADEWAPNLVKMFAGGLADGAPSMRAAAAQAMAGVRGALSGGASTSLSLSASASGLAGGVSPRAAAGLVGPAGASVASEQFARTLIRVLKNEGGLSKPVILAVDGNQLARTLISPLGHEIRIATGIRTM